MKSTSYNFSKSELSGRLIGAFATEVFLNQDSFYVNFYQVFISPTGEKHVVSNKIFCNQGKETLLLEHRYCKTYEIVLNSDVLLRKILTLLGTQNCEESSQSSSSTTSVCSQSK